MTEIKFGSFEVMPVSAAPKRFTGLIWGSSGTGKTTLAATAPGKKMLVNFDPDGEASLGNVPEEEIVVADLSSASPSTIEQLKRDNPFRIQEFIAEHEIDTVIVDSITSLSDLAVRHAVGQIRSATYERPSLQGYGYRNAYVVQVVKAFLRATSKTNTHCIFIAHEDLPSTNDEGVVLQISVMLGGKLAEHVPLQLSEVWNLSDTGRERRIAIRPVRSRKPMKTRMFQTKGDPEFVWEFDPDAWEGDTISSWYNAWVNNGGKKIAIPKKSKKETKK